MRLRFMYDMLYRADMKTITIRDLRHHWPKAEAALQVEGEILITRDAKAVAKLVRIEQASTKRPKWNSDEHARWQEEVAEGVVTSSGHLLEQIRGERFPLRKKK